MSLQEDEYKRQVVLSKLKNLDMDLDMKGTTKTIVGGIIALELIKELKK